MALVCGWDVYSLPDAALVSLWMRKPGLTCSPGAGWGFCSYISCYRVCLHGGWDGFSVSVAGELFQPQMGQFT